MPTYILNPNLRLSHCANRYFTYDARVASYPLVEIPTRQIEQEEYAMLHKLKTQGFFIEPQSKEDILAYFSEQQLPPKLFDTLLQRNLLKKCISPVETVQNKVLDFFNTRYASPDKRETIKQRPPFDESDENLHVFSPRTFFNLPSDIDLQACQVGLLGVPHASLHVSLGTEVAPSVFRLHSRSLCWFDIHRQGVYSEINIEGGRPEILCKDVVVKDYGDLDFQDVTLLQMIDEIKRELARSFFDNHIYPLIVGGDHAITYPIVAAYLEASPNLGLLHLDAHNDLFYTPSVVYSHAAPISNIVQHTQIKRVVSFGLRTFSDKRVGGVQSIYEGVGASERIRLYCLTALKQLIMTRGALEQELEKLADRPYYLTLDLDVLSESAVGGQLSTPFGSGLEWHELLYFLDVAFRKLDIVGCDVVEYDCTHGEGGNQN